VRRTGVVLRASVLRSTFARLEFSVRRSFFERPSSARHHASRIAADVFAHVGHIDRRCE
jgi:hypothetical protein